MRVTPSKAMNLNCNGFAPSFARRHRHQDDGEICDDGNNLVEVCNYGDAKSNVTSTAEVCSATCQGHS